MPEFISKEKRAKAIELKFEESTIGVMESYANMLFQKNADLISFEVQGTTHSPCIALFARYDNTILSITVSRYGNSMLRLHVSKQLDSPSGNCWSYSLYIGPQLLHFNQILHAFPNLFE